MNDRSNTNINNQPCSNLEGIARAVALAMLHAGKITDKSVRADLVCAGLEALKTTIVDELAHTIGIGKVSDEIVVGRLAMLGSDMEEVRRERINRFSVLCELLKPDIDIDIVFADVDTTSFSAGTGPAPKTDPFKVGDIVLHRVTSKFACQEYRGAIKSIDGDHAVILTENGDELEVELALLTREAIKPASASKRNYAEVES